MRTPTLAFIVAALGAPLAAQAQELNRADRAQRQELLESAFRVSNDGHHRVALSLAEQAAAIQLTPSLMLFLAEEHEYLSHDADGNAHLMQAVSFAGRCVHAATEQTAIRDRERVLANCTDVFNRLNTRVARLRVVVPQPAPSGLVVRVNDQVLPEASWNVVTPMLPGEVTVDAVAPQRGTFRHVYHLTAGANQSAELDLPAPPPPPPPPPPPLPPTRVETVVVPNSGATALRVIGGVVTGLGLIAAGVGVWQLVVTSNQSQESLDGTSNAWLRYANNINYPVNGSRPLSADQVCARAATDAPTNSDAAQVNSLCDANRTSTALAYAFGISGAVMTVVGTVLLLLPQRTHTERRTVSWSVAPSFGASGGGALLNLRF